MTGEELENSVLVSPVAVEAARTIYTALSTELKDPDSVLYEAVATRWATMPEEAQFGIGRLLLTDPMKSGVTFERYRLQSGAIPESGVDDSSIERTVALWSTVGSAVPKLVVPEGADERVMRVADSMQMRGGGPVVYSREQVAQVPVSDGTVLHVVGAANNAPRERVQSALAFIESHNAPDARIIATVDASRVLRQAELDKVASFAPNAKNEAELMIDSAVSQGFVASADNRYGTRTLQDGSSYTTLRHANGATLILLQPAPHTKDDGTKQTGVFNAYSALLKNPDLLGGDLTLEDSNIVHISSTHYGAMAILNNLRAVHELRFSTEAFHVIGDNQSSRTAQAHLIELGLATDAIDQMLREPTLKTALLGTE